MSINKVIQLIEQDKDSKLIINENALKLIENLNEPIGVIVTVGKKRIGKSFLLNRILDIDCKNGFQISHVDEPCTKGIFLSSKIIQNTNKNGDKMKLILLDTEGLESNEVTKEWDSKIFILSLLLSSHFIYNTNLTYTRDDLEKISLITQISSKVKKNANNQMNINDYPELMWICRDYKFEIKTENDATDALNEFLQKKDSDSENIKNTKNCIKKSFNKINGFYLPFPDLTHQNGNSSKKLLLNIEKYNWDDFQGEFCDELNKLCRKIKEDVQIKKMNGMKLKGTVFAEFLRKIVHCLNNDQTILVVDMIDVITKMNADRSLDEIKKKYSEELKALFKNFPIEWKRMNSLEKKARNSGLEELSKSIEGSLYDKYKDTFEKYVFDPSNNSGVFSMYVQRNTTSIKKYTEENFLEIKNLYRKEMQNKFANGNLPCNWEYFETTENEISNRLFENFKNKIKEFTNNNGEDVADLELYEKTFNEFREYRNSLNVRISGESFIYYKRNLDALIEKFERFLKKEWDSVRHVSSTTSSFTLQQYDDKIKDLEKNYSSLTPDSPEKKSCWDKYYDMNFDNLKKILRDKIDNEKKIKQLEESSKKPYIQPGNFFNYLNSYYTPPSTPSNNSSTKSSDVPRCKDGSRDMRYEVNWGYDKYD